MSREIYAGILKTRRVSSTPHVPGAECVLAALRWVQMAALRWVQIINRLLQNVVVDKDAPTRTRIGAIFFIRRCPISMTCSQRALPLGWAIEGGSRCGVLR